MAVKRNTRITSVLGSIDRRVKSLEAVGALALPAGTTIQEVDPDSDPRDGVSSIPPDTYRKVIGARIYGAAATGNFGTRVELYFEEDEDELAVIEEEDAAGNQTLQQIQVYGVNGYSGTSIALSSGKVFKPIEVAYDDPDWAENGLRESADQTDWRQTPPVSAISSKTVNSTLWYNPVTQDPDKTDKNGKDLVVTRAVDSASVEGANVTVTFNASSHLFKVGDVVSVDIPAPFIGLDYYNTGEPDGLFEITAVTGNTISYVLDAPVTSPETYEYDGITRHYVYAVARPYVPDGTVWIDENTEPNTVWVWKKLRWYNTADPIGDVAAEQDGIAPSPVTDLDVTSELPTGSRTPVLNLTWTPPTTRSNGASISGFLDGYDIWYKRSTETVWKKEFVKDGGQGVAAHQIKDAILLQNFTYNIRVYTVDIMGQYSTVAEDSVLTASFSETLNPPSAPVATSKLGTITVTWDGLDSAGELPVPGVLYIEFHESTTSGFTPSSSTLVESVPITNSGNYIVLTERLFDGTTTYYYKTKFVRQISPTELESSDPSAQDSIIVTGVTGPDIVAGSVTTNKLEAGFVTAELLRGNIIRAGTAGANARVELKTSGIFAYNSANDPVFSFDTSSSTLTIGGYATNSNVSAVSDTANSKLDPANVISEINSRHTTSGTSTTTTISGGAIRTGTIDAARILVTDTFSYKNPANTYEVQIGQAAIPSYAGNSAGVNFINSSVNAGYIGVYGGNSTFELGKDFSDAYLSFGLNGGNQLTANFTNGYYFGGTTFELGAALKVARFSSAAVYVGRESGLGTERTLSIDTGSYNVLVGNGNLANTVNTLDVFGRIRATGTITANTSVSSIRYKADVREFTAPIEFLDITPKLYKYDNHILYETWPDSYANSLPQYSEDHVGAIAEDFLAVGLDYLVYRDEEGRPEALDYAKISVLLIPYIKDLYSQIAELKRKSA